LLWYLIEAICQPSPRHHGGLDMSNGLSTTQLTLKEALDLYESGKHRRYGLLFSVHGGAFAVAKLLKGEHGEPPVVLGSLTLQELAFGMALFTVIMVIDIYFFGDNMRTRYSQTLFEPQGKVVLVLIGALLCFGWFLAGSRCISGAY
jgi:hypothetical protein